MAGLFLGCSSGPPHNGGNGPEEEQLVWKSLLWTPTLFDNGKPPTDFLLRLAAQQAVEFAMLPEIQRQTVIKESAYAGRWLLPDPGKATTSWPVRIRSGRKLVALDGHVVREERALVEKEASYYFSTDSLTGSWKALRDAFGEARRENPEALLEAQKEHARCLIATMKVETRIDVSSTGERRLQVKVSSTDKGPWRTELTSLPLIAITAPGKDPDVEHAFRPVRWDRWTEVEVPRDLDVVDVHGGILHFFQPIPLGIQEGVEVRSLAIRSVTVREESGGGEVSGQLERGGLYKVTLRFSRAVDEAHVGRLEARVGGEPYTVELETGSLPSMEVSGTWKAEMPPAAVSADLGFYYHPVKGGAERCGSASWEVHRSHLERMLRACPCDEHSGDVQICVAEVFSRKDVQALNEELRRTGGDPFGLEDEADLDVLDGVLMAMANAMKFGEAAPAARAEFRDRVFAILERRPSVDLLVRLAAGGGDPLPREDWEELFREIQILDRKWNAMESGAASKPAPDWLVLMGEIRDGLERVEQLVPRRKELQIDSVRDLTLRLHSLRLPEILVLRVSEVAPLEMRALLPEGATEGAASVRYVAVGQGGAGLVKEPEKGGREALRGAVQAIGFDLPRQKDLQNQHLVLRARQYEYVLAEDGTLRIWDWGKEDLVPERDERTLSKTELAYRLVLEVDVSR